MITTLKEKYNRDMNGDVLIVDPPWNIHDEKKNGVRFFWMMRQKLGGIK